jgi:hypothetical protein
METRNAEPDHHDGVQDVNMDRRLHMRHAARTQVYVSVPGQPIRRCKAANVSSSGVFLEGATFKLPRGTEVELIFAVDLGTLTRIHRRNAVVAHVSSNGAGLKMKSYETHPKRYARGQG